MKSCKKYLENIEQAFSYTMQFFAQNSPIYPKLQHKKDCLTGLSFAKAYENMKSCQK